MEKVKLNFIEVIKSFIQKSNELPKEMSLNEAIAMEKCDSKISKELKDTISTIAKEEKNIEMSMEKIKKNPMQKVKVDNVKIEEVKNVEKKSKEIDLEK